jgi:hypothetical protein
MNPPQHFMKRLGEIVGDDLSDGSLDLNIKWYGREARAMAEIRKMKRELGMLKREITAVIAEIKSGFASETAVVGLNLGTALASLTVGRRFTGKMNTLHRDALRREKVEKVAPYEHVKEIIQRVVMQLDHAKDQIMLSSETVEDDEGDADEASAEEEQIVLRFFIYLDEQVKGPYSLDQVKALEDTGFINGETQVCHEGTENWNPWSLFDKETGTLEPTEGIVTPPENV